MDFELFGQNEEWKTVLEGARSICGRRLQQNQMPKFLTRAIRDLVDEVRNARDLYEQLSSSRGTAVGSPDGPDGLNDDLKKILDALHDKIASLSEETAAGKASEMIRDIHVGAIPAMVFLLQSALQSRVYYFDRPYDLETANKSVEGLGEICRLQDMAISLCTLSFWSKCFPICTVFRAVRHVAQAICSLDVSHSLICSRNE